MNENILSPKIGANVLPVRQFANILAARRSKKKFLQLLNFIQSTVSSIFSNTYLKYSLSCILTSIQYAREVQISDSRTIAKLCQQEIRVYSTVPA
jgi:hypothetical protein